VKPKCYGAINSGMFPPFVGKELACRPAPPNRSFPNKKKITCLHIPVTIIRNRLNALFFVKNEISF
jgi:hypothetical protein